MKSLKGTKTLEGLANAYAGESQARNRYTFYSKVADKEGHKQIAAVFMETADNERAHAKVFFDLIVQGKGTDHIKVNAEYPLNYGNAEENLTYAADGEKEEWGTLYPQFADIAKQEGFSEVEMAFRKIMEIEKGHEKRFRDLHDSLFNGTLYKRDTEQYWKCRNCGYIFQGNEAPKICPACKHPQGYFEIMYNTKA
ncbi:MAG: rubrerythrin [Clostridiaceae bacterium]